jgi:predicted transcriptional regulator
MSGTSESSDKEDTLEVPLKEPLNEMEAGEQFEAAADNLLDVANETLAAIRRAREETRAALDNLEARLSSSLARRETRMALDELETRLASSNLSREQFSSVKRPGQLSAAPQPNALKPAVPIQKSVTTDYLICLEDGKKLKMMKRHLRSAYNMTPDEYRRKWGLAPDYPMVAPTYGRQRRSKPADARPASGARGSRRDP